MKHIVHYVQHLDIVNLHDLQGQDVVIMHVLNFFYFMVHILENEKHQISHDQDHVKYHLVY